MFVVNSTDVGPPTQEAIKQNKICEVKDVRYVDFVKCISFAYILLVLLVIIVWRSLDGGRS
jgi:hypothetical protein